MDEYIKRDYAIDAVLDVYYDTPDIDLSGEKFEAAILKIPPADVAPVRHGRWIDKGEYAVCMECGGRSGTQYDGVEPIPLMTQFCPNCGAKMDELVEENKE